MTFVKEKLLWMCNILFLWISCRIILTISLIWKIYIQIWQVLFIALHQNLLNIQLFRVFNVYKTLNWQKGQIKRSTQVFALYNQINIINQLSHIYFVTQKNSRWDVSFEYLHQRGLRSNNNLRTCNSPLI